MSVENPRHFVHEYYETERYLCIFLFVYEYAPTLTLALTLTLTPNPNPNPYVSVQGDTRGHSRLRVHACLMPNIQSEI